jgi:hypothetical protein
MIGKVAKCLHNKVGIITNVVYPLYGERIHYGITFGGKPWQSIKPTILADSVEEYIKNNIEQFLPLAEPSKV